MHGQAAAASDVPLVIRESDAVSAKMRRHPADAAAGRAICRQPGGGRAVELQR